MWATIVTDGGKAGGNAGFVVGDDGIAVIDTFEDAGAARELLAAIRQISSLPIRFVVNTHYHLDHVAGNEASPALAPWWSLTVTSGRGCALKT